MGPTCSKTYTLLPGLLVQPKARYKPSELPAQAGRCGGHRTLVKKRINGHASVNELHFYHTCRMNCDRTSKPLLFTLAELAKVTIHHVGITLGTVLSLWGIHTRNPNSALHTSHNPDSPASNISTKLRDC